MQSLIMTLLTCSLTMSLIILLYLALLSLLTKRYTERGCYYAWLVIVLGLIIPFRPHLGQAMININVPRGAVASDLFLENVNAVAADYAALPHSPVVSSFSVWTVVFAIWLAGMVLFIAWHLICHFRFMKMADRWKEPITDEEVLLAFQQIREEMNLSKNVDLYQCSCVSSPMLTGVVNPQVLLPDLALAPEELRFILGHELVHHRRKDLWYKCLVLLSVAIHWFNPVVYVMAKAIQIQCELSCDQEVVCSKDIDIRQHYSETIIGVIQHQSKQNTLLSTQFYGGKKGMKKRIFSIMDMRPKKTGVVILCAALIMTMGTGLGFTTNAAANLTQKKEEHTYLGRQDSLVQDFEKYKPFGVVYRPDQDAVYYNNERVKLFVEFKSHKEATMTYAFDLCYQDSAADSTLYLEAVKGSNGSITGIRPLKQEIAEELLSDMVTASPQPSINQPSHVKDFFAVTMDATQTLEKHGIVAKDLTKDKAPEAIKGWIKQCDQQLGTYRLTSKTSGGYITYIYYNEGGRYPWNLSIDGDQASLNLYSDNGLATDEGYYLMYFTSPVEYTNLNLYLDGTALNDAVARQ